MSMETGEELLAVMRDYQVPCLLAAAADLDIFNALAQGPREAAEVAAQQSCDARATAVLLDALASVGLVVKDGGRYALPPAWAPFLADGSGQSVAAMLRHQAHCLRRWAQLPWVVRSGKPAAAAASVRGAEADNASFIEAMNVVSRPIADQLVAEIHPGRFRCLLDLGGGSGTWTLAWLRGEPSARAILFDLPDVIPLARSRIAGSGAEHRVTLVAGDYNSDPLPRGADLAWVSAIVHQNSPQQNRSLFRRLAEAMEPGSSVLIRDVVMDPTRTRPRSGALFALNMLVGTEGGGTYTLAEIGRDLEAAGFQAVRLVRKDEGMNSVVAARRG